MISLSTLSPPNKKVIKIGTSKTHELTLKNYIEELKSQGYKAFDLNRKCPDGIAVKDGKVYAIEVLGTQKKKGKGNHRKWTFRGKRKEYYMFDDVLFKTFSYSSPNYER